MSIVPHDATPGAPTNNPGGGPPADPGAFNPNDAQILQYLGLDPNRPADRAAVTVARHYGLDPVLKHLTVIPKSGVYITRDGLLHVAHRSGQLDGIVVDTEPTLSEDGTEWVARVTVYRKDMRHGFTFPGRYPVEGKNRDYAPEMALKAAEAHAMRRAFDVTGLPTYDETRPAPRPGAAGARSGIAAALPRADGEGVPDDPPNPAPSPSPSETGPGPEYEDASPPLDVNSRLAKAMFAGIRAAQNAGTVTNAHEFMSEVTGRDITSSRDLTEDETRRLLDHLPTQGESE